MYIAIGPKQGKGSAVAGGATYSEEIEALSKEVLDLYSIFLYLKLEQVKIPLHLVSMVYADCSLALQSFDYQHGMGVINCYTLIVEIENFTCMLFLALICSHSYHNRLFQSEKILRVRTDVSGLHTGYKSQALSGPSGKRKRFLLCKVARYRSTLSES